MRAGRRQREQRRVAPAHGRHRLPRGDPRRLGRGRHRAPLRRDPAGSSPALLPADRIQEGLASGTRAPSRNTNDPPGGGHSRAG
ncbi:unnamed protein product [Coccothraustes coccothraustes]